MQNRNPWKDIPEVEQGGQGVGATLVNPESNWRFYWSQDAVKSSMLILRHTAAVSENLSIPKLRDIEITIHPYPGVDTDAVLTFRLLNEDLQDIFYQLCVDIMAAADSYGAESAAVRSALDRTWQWYHLLRGGGQRLSMEEQKGLIGELLVLRKLILPRVAAAEGVASWTGPKGAPKDFSLGAVAIESKARRGSAAPFISITSEHQLDDADVDCLFLHVAEIDRSVSEAGFTLPQLVNDIRSEIAADDQAAVIEYDSLITAAGCTEPEEYAEIFWKEGKSRLYQVVEGFPRVIGSVLSQGVGNLRYRIALLNCRPYEVDIDVFNSVFGG